MFHPYVSIVGLRANNLTTRVKLPKSFLAVNLSETHTFHKKEEPGGLPEGTATMAEMEAEVQEGLKNLEIEKTDRPAGDVPEDS